MNRIHIKNMVCPRCIRSVESVFSSVDLDPVTVKLGEVVVREEPNQDQLAKLSALLTQLGFEILEDSRSRLIERIKTLVIEQVHESKEGLKVNFSDYLAEQCGHSYSYLSRLFSEVAGITIEKYVMGQKIEKVKELLFYDEATLTEIAFKLNYSSVSHLSSQFRKETGMTPTEFRKRHKPAHRALDSIG